MEGKDSQQQSQSEQAGEKVGETRREGSARGEKPRTIIVQHSPILKESCVNVNPDTLAAPSKFSKHQLSSAKSNGYEAPKSPSSLAHVGNTTFTTSTATTPKTTGTTVQKLWFNNSSQLGDGGESRLPEGTTLNDIRNGEKSSGRLTSRRRILYNNNNHNHNKTELDKEVDLSKDVTPTSAPPTKTISPMSSLRLSDLKRPVSTNGQISLRQKSNNAKRARVQQKILNLSLCKYPLLRTIAEEYGFKVQETEEELEKNMFNIVWSDTVLPLTRLVRLANWQRTNHFPSMHLLCRKGHLGITLGKMRKVLPTHYVFYPRTWSLRSERLVFSRFMMAIRTKKINKFFIMKPNSGCQGRGIIITRDPLNSVEDCDNYIVQEYITRPLLLEGRKFDLRVYVLLTSIRAPSIFLFNDGLVRLCAEVYDKPTDGNVRNTCKHLTNYAVNKHSPDYIFNDDAANSNVGNKRNFKFLNEWLNSSGESPDLFWERVAHVICKTILVAQPQISNVYNSCFPRQNDGYNCFEVLGFDILIDGKMKPWLLEVNHTPSFATDTPLDYDIKHSLLSEVFDILDIKTTDRQKSEKQERNEFVQRILRQPVSTSNFTTNKSTGGVITDPGISSSSPSTSSLPTQQSPLYTTTNTTNNNNTSSTTTTHASNVTFLSTLHEQASEWAKLVEERRAREDSKLRNFKRIYPSRNTEHQLVYEAVLAQARAQCASPHPSWSSSPAPSSPQTGEDRHRRLDTLSSLGPSSGSGFNNNNNNNGISTNNTNTNNNNNGTTKSMTGLSRVVQMQKLCDDMMITRRRGGKLTPWMSPTSSSATRERSNNNNNNNNSTLNGASSMMEQNSNNNNSHSIPVLSKPSSAIVPPQSVQERRRPVVEHTEGITRKSHNNHNNINNTTNKTTITAAINTTTTTALSLSVPSVTVNKSPTPTEERMEALRTLQERLDHDAECEHSPSQDSGEDSFTLGEE